MKAIAVLLIGALASLPVSDERASLDILWPMLGAQEIEPLSTLDNWPDECQRARNEIFSDRVDIA